MLTQHHTAAGAMGEAVIAPHPTNIVIAEANWAVIQSASSQQFVATRAGGAGAGIVVCTDGVGGKSANSSLAADEVVKPSTTGGIRT